MGVERAHELMGVPAKCDADTTFLRLCNVVALSVVVERKQLDHQMMHAVPAGLDQRQAVMPRVDMKEIGAKRLFDVVGEPEAQHVDIERHYGVDVLDRQYGMPEPERTGAETRDRSPRHKGRVVDLGAVQGLQPAAGGMPRPNQTLGTASVGPPAR